MKLLPVLVLGIALSAFAEGLPKTRSGKIMRRLLKDIANGRATQGDVSTLEDLNVLAKLRGNDE